MICPTCGCSLVRLGIAPSPGLSVPYRGVEHFFCCAGCRDLFMGDPERYLCETELLRICPVCLAEKPASQTVRASYADQEVFFCRCPHCFEEFHRRPAYYIARLEGRIEYVGVFTGRSPCCPPGAS